MQNLTPVIPERLCREYRRCFSGGVGNTLHLAGLLAQTICVIERWPTFYPCAGRASYDLPLGGSPTIFCAAKSHHFFDANLNPRHSRAPLSGIQPLIFCWSGQAFHPNRKLDALIADPSSKRGEYFDSTRLFLPNNLKRPKTTLSRHCQQHAVHPFHKLCRICQRTAFS